MSDDSSGSHDNFDEKTFKAAAIGESVNEAIYNTLYEDPDAAIREIIANAYDAYNDKKYIPHEYEKTVDIRINKEKKTIQFVDYATGIIVPIEDFKIIFYNTPEQAKSKESVGEFHIGKGSVLKLCNQKNGKMPMAVFRSNNGEEGLVLPMVFNKKIGYLDQYRYEKFLASQARYTIGLTVEVRNVIEEMLDIKEIAKIVSKYFGILIARKKLYVNIMETYTKADPKTNREKLYITAVYNVKPPENLKTDREIKKPPHCQTSQYGWISTHLDNILRPKSRNIDIYHKYVYVKSTSISYCCEGWINCDDFRLNLAKDGFLTGPGTAYTDGMKNFEEKYLPLFFEKQHYKESKLTHEKDMNKLYENMLNAALPTFDKEMTDLLGLADKESKLTGVVSENKSKQGQMQVLPGQILTKDTGNENGNPVIPIGGGHRGPGTRTDGEGNKPGIQNGGNHNVLIPKQGCDKSEKQHTTIKTKPKIVKGRLGPDEPECKINDKWQMVLNEDTIAIQELLNIPVQRRLAILRMPFTLAIVEAFTKERSRPLTVIEYRKKCSEVFSRSFL